MAQEWIPNMLANKIYPKRVELCTFYSAEVTAVQAVESGSSKGCSRASPPEPVGDAPSLRLHHLCLTRPPSGARRYGAPRAAGRRRRPSEPPCCGAGRRARAQPGVPIAKPLAIKQDTRESGECS